MGLGWDWVTILSACLGWKKAQRTEGGFEECYNEKVFCSYVSKVMPKLYTSGDVNDILLVSISANLQKIFSVKEY